MKWIIVFLVILNIGILAYFKFAEANQALLQVRPPPLQPEKIKILTPKDIEALPKKEEPAAPAAPIPPTAMMNMPAPACYEWGTFSVRNLPRARNVLAKYAANDHFSLNVKVEQQLSQASTRYWVYIPKRASAQAAQAKMEELKALNIDDIFVVQEPQWRYAISLGVFKDEQLANKRLEDVQNRGVVSAVKAVRNQEQGQTSLIINNMSPLIAAEIEKLKPDFPGSEIKQITCQ